MCKNEQVTCNVSMSQFTGCVREIRICRIDQIKTISCVGSFWLQKGVLD